MSEAARAYVTREHDLEHTAELYVAALEEAAGGTAVANAVVGEIAHAAAEIGIEQGSAFAQELTLRLDELELARNGRPEPGARRPLLPAAQYPSPTRW